MWVSTRVVTKESYKVGGEHQISICVKGNKGRINFIKIIEFPKCIYVITLVS